MLLDVFGLTCRVGRCHANDVVGGQQTGSQQVLCCEPKVLRVGVREAEKPSTRALHEFVGLALGGDEHCLVLLDDAQRGGALEAGAVENEDGVEVVNGLKAGSVALLLRGWTKQRHLDRLEGEHAASDASALFVDVVDVHPEHLVHVADRNAKADVDGVLKARLDVHDRDLVGSDAVVGVETVRSGVVSDAVAVELGERVVTAIEAGLEVGKDSPARIDVDVRLVAVGGLATTIIASGVVGGGGIFGTRVVTAVFGSVVATGGSTAVLAGVVGYLATACCRQQC